MSAMYKAGEVVYIVAEYMYAALYPSGHTEKYAEVDCPGMILDVVEFNGSVSYEILLEEVLPDNEYHITVEEDEIEYSFKFNVYESIEQMVLL